MTNARRHTLFGAGHGIGRPRQVNSEYGTAAADQKATQTQAAKLRGAGVIRHSLVNARPSRTPQGHAGVAG